MGSPNDEGDMTAPPSSVEARAFVESPPVGGKPQMEIPQSISPHTRESTENPAHCFRISSSKRSASHCFIIDW